MDHDPPVRSVAVLFVRPDSIYKSMPGVDAWDAERDAREWPGGMPVVAHPPCRGWGRLRHFARPRPGETMLAQLAVDQVRRWGGVLEHPAHSALWVAAGLPAPTCRDQHGGWTLAVLQSAWGHPADKPTWLYICGVGPRDIPPLPLRLGPAPGMIGSHPRRRDGSRMNRDDPRWRPEIAKADRERTPRLFAEWLVELARRTNVADA